MAEVKTEALFDCSIEQLYSILSDYEQYPEFLPEVKSVKILKPKGTQKIVKYSISLIKEVSYSLAVTESPSTAISWVLDKGTLFKALEGSWELSQKGKKTKAVYNLSIQFKIFAPEIIEKTLVNVNLKSMMSALQDRVKELYS